MPGLPIAPAVVPRRTWHDVHALWDIGTDVRGPGGEEVRLSYHRAPVLGYTRGYAGPVIQALGLSPTHKICVVGAGFGFLAEVLRDDFGWPNDRLVSLDVSPYFVGARSSTEEADINTALQGVGLSINTDPGKTAKGQLFDGAERGRTRFASSRLDSQSAANSVKGMFPSSAVDYVLTDDGYLDYHSDAQVTEVLDAVSLLGGQAVHLVYEDWTDTSRPLADWKALRPAHQFVSMWSWQVL